MNSVVCIAHVPDTESKIVISDDGTRINEAGLKYIVSPYDEFALEEAVKLMEADGGEVTVVSFGPDRVQQGLRECLARGATKAIHIQGEPDRADSFGIAKVLAAAIGTVEHDLVFFGKQGVGTDNSLVGSMVAEILDYPQLNVVTHLERDGETLRAHREVEGAEELLESSIPAVITAQKGLNEPRYSSLKGIMAAKKKPIESKTLEDLNLDASEIYDARVRIVKLEEPPAKSPGRTIDGSDAAAAASEIIDYIKNEAKAL